MRPSTSVFGTDPRVGENKRQIHGVILPLSSDFSLKICTVNDLCSSPTKVGTTHESPQNLILYPHYNNSIKRNCPPWGPCRTPAREGVGERKNEMGGRERQQQNCKLGKKQKWYESQQTKKSHPRFTKTPLKLHGIDVDISTAWKFQRRHRWSTTH